MSDADSVPVEMEACRLAATSAEGWLHVAQTGRRRINVNPGTLHNHGFGRVSAGTRLRTMIVLDTVFAK